MGRFLLLFFHDRMIGKVKDLKIQNTLFDAIVYILMNNQVENVKQLHCYCWLYLYVFFVKNILSKLEQSFFRDRG